MNIACLAPAHGGRRSAPSPDNVGFGSSSSGDGDGGRRDARTFSTPYDGSCPPVGIHSLCTVLNRPSRKTFSVSLAGAGALIASALDVGVSSPSKELPSKPMPSGSNEPSIESSRGMPPYACARCSSVKKFWSMPGLLGPVADGYSYSSHVEEDGVGPASR